MKMIDSTFDNEDFQPRDKSVQLGNEKGGSSYKFPSNYEKYLDDASIDSNKNVMDGLDAMIWRTIINDIGHDNN